MLQKLYQTNEKHGINFFSYIIYDIQHHVQLYSISKFPNILTQKLHKTIENRLCISDTILMFLFDKVI